jgi:hypothetical protein
VKIVRDKLIKVVERKAGDPGKDLWLYVEELDNVDGRNALWKYPLDGEKTEI